MSSITVAKSDELIIDTAHHRKRSAAGWHVSCHLSIIFPLDWRRDGGRDAMGQNSSRYAYLTQVGHGYEDTVGRHHRDHPARLGACTPKRPIHAVGQIDYDADGPGVVVGS